MLKRFAGTPAPFKIIYNDFSCAFLMASEFGPVAVDR